MLMRSIKSVGSLTRGRGMNDIQQAVWTLSQPATMQNLAKYCTLQENSARRWIPHYETGIKKDTETITEYLQERNPFWSEADLKSITSGFVSNNSNVDQAREIGEKVVLNMVGITVSEYIFRKKDIVIQMNDKAVVKYITIFHNKTQPVFN